VSLVIIVDDAMKYIETRLAAPRRLLAVANELCRDILIRLGDHPSGSLSFHRANLRPTPRQSWCVISHPQERPPSRNSRPLARRGHDFLRLSEFAMTGGPIRARGFNR